MNIIETMGDPELFEPWFLGRSWRTWRIALKGAYALPMTKAERGVFRTIAGREPPRKPVRECWFICGRRAGKDSIASLMAGHTAAFFDPHGKLRRGERASVLCLAVDREQAGIVLGYIKSYYAEIPYLKQMVIGETQNGLELSNGIDIVVATNDFRSVRGRAVAMAILDEVGYWDRSVASDGETFNAIVPGTVTVGGMIVGISTPHKKSGLLYERWRSHYGQKGDVLVIRAPSLTMNPTLDKKLIAAEIERDPGAGRAEWLAQWREDVDTFLSDEVIDAAINRSRPLELPPQRDTQYVMRADAAGGSGSGESYTVAVSHRDRDGRAIVDLVRGVSGTFDPHQVTRDYAALARQYRVSEVVVDNYARQWVQQSWHDAGIPCHKSELRQSDIYLEVISLFTRSLVELPDHPRLLRELRGLERVTRKFGRDTVDHPKGGTDDFSAVTCGALLDASTAAGALWQREHLLADSAALPRKVAGVFAVVTAREHEIAAVFFGRSPAPNPEFDLGTLYVVDQISEPLSARFFPVVRARLRALYETMHCWAGAFIVTSSVLAGEFERQKIPVTEKIDTLLRDEMLPVAASMHIGAGRVRVVGEAQAGVFLHGGHTDDSPARLAFLAGVCLAFDAGRSLKPKVA